MKRILTLFAVLSMVLPAMAQNQGIMLSYNKGQQLKFYRSDQLMKAINEAEVNDTLYFSSGSFDFNQLPQINGDYYRREWSKPLVLIGAGAQDENGTSMSMDGTLFLKFDDSVPLEKRNMSLEGIRIPNWVCPASEINQLSFVNFRGDFYDRNDLIETPGDADENWQKPHTYIQKAIFDQCVMEHINLDERNIDNCMVKNSKINYLEGKCSDRIEGQAFSLDHCRVGDLNNSFEGLIQNSLVRYDHGNGSVQLNSCGIYSSDNNSIRDNKCVGISWIDDIFGNDIPSANEGTLVLEDGSNMGTSPQFSLFPSYPTIDPSQSEIDYDGINKAVKVSLTLLKQQ